jgi:hypothetical protein
MLLTLNSKRVKILLLSIIGGILISCIFNTGIDTSGTQEATFTPITSAPENVPSSNPLPEPTPPNPTEGTPFTAIINTESQCIQTPLADPPDRVVLADIPLEETVLVIGKSNEVENLWAEGEWAYVQWGGTECWMLSSELTPQNFDFSSVPVTPMKPYPTPVPTIAGATSVNGETSTPAPPPTSTDTPIPPCPIPSAPMLDGYLSKFLSTYYGHLSWNAPDGATKYQIYRSVNGGSYDFYKELQGLTYSEAIPKHSTYSYEVVAINSCGGRSNPSNPKSFSP